MKTTPAEQPALNLHAWSALRDCTRELLHYRVQLSKACRHRSQSLHIFSANSFGIQMHHLILNLAGLIKMLSESLLVDLQG